MCAIVRRSTSQCQNVEGMENNKKKFESDEKFLLKALLLFHYFSLHEHTCMYL